MERPGSVGVQGLVLGYVSTRGYHDSSAAEHQQSSWSDEEDERLKHREGMNISNCVNVYYYFFSIPDIAVYNKFIRLQSKKIKITENIIIRV